MKKSLHGFHQPGRQEVQSVKDGDDDVFLRTKLLGNKANNHSKNKKNKKNNNNNKNT